jgi:hypothetical protein
LNQLTQEEKQFLSKLKEEDAPKTDETEVNQDPLNDLMDFGLGG